jgi:hypothetical protein
MIPCGRVALFKKRLREWLTEKITLEHMT